MDAVLGDHPQGGGPVGAPDPVAAAAAADAAVKHQHVRATAVAEVELAFGAEIVVLDPRLERPQGGVVHLDAVADERIIRECMTLGNGLIEAFEDPAPFDGDPGRPDAGEIGVHRVDLAELIDRVEPLLVRQRRAVKNFVITGIRFFGNGVERIFEGVRPVLVGGGKLSSGGAVDGRSPGAGEVIVEIIRIEVHQKADLFEVGDTGGRPRPFPRLVQRRQQHGGENGDDRDNDKDYLLNIHLTRYK